MIKMLIGAAFGALGSWVVAEIYHRRSRREMENELEQLNSENARLSEALAEMRASQEAVATRTETIHKHAVAGTPDDPDYPYK